MNNILNFNFCKKQKLIADTMQEVDYTVQENDSPEVTETQQILSVIFQTAEDGFPCGDLAWFVGNKANPEVQQFILKNLMNDVSSQATPSITGLSDDEVASFVRQSGESVRAYAERLNDVISKSKAVIDHAKRAVQSSKVQKSDTE